MYRISRAPASGLWEIREMCKSWIRRAHPTAWMMGVLLLTMGATASAQGTDIIMKGYDEPTSSDLEWKENKAVPPGMQIILIYGNPKEKGPYIFRAKMPAGYKLPAHKHEDQRIVTVLTGTYWSGAGETFDQSKLTKFAPSSFYVTGAGVPHFAWAETDVIIQEQGMGPIGNPIEYVNPADDPRKK